MSNTVKAAAAVALGLTLQCLPVASQASLVAGTGATAGVIEEAAPAATTFLDQALDRRETSLGAVSADRAFTMSRGGRSISFTRHGGNELDLGLWNLLNIVQSQKGGRPFDELENHFQYQVDNPANQVTVDPDLSAVPLPATVWLFLMGLLGLAGARVTGINGEGAAAAGRSPAPTLNAAAA